MRALRRSTELFSLMTVLLLLTLRADAGVVGIDGDTTLEGGWGLFDSVQPYGPMEVILTDDPVYTDVVEWPTSLGDVELDHAFSKRKIGQGWATWSHGYTGEVFYSNGSGYGLFTMPPNTGAFDAYVETGPFQWWDYIFTAYATDGSTAVIEKQIHGDHGAAHFGFFTTGGAKLIRVELEQVPGTGYSIGEMRIAGVSCEGDVTADGVVDVQDLIQVLSEWGQHAGAADQTGDGVVDVQDLLIVLSAWGPC